MGEMDALIHRFFHGLGRSFDPQTATVNQGAGTSGIAIAAPAAGGRIIVLDAVVTSNAAGRVQFFHTDATAPNAITEDLLTAAGIPLYAGGWALPPAQPLLVGATTANYDGWVSYAISAP